MRNLFKVGDEVVIKANVSDFYKAGAVGTVVYVGFTDYKVHFISGDFYKSNDNTWYVSEENMEFYNSRDKITLLTHHAFKMSAQECFKRCEISQFIIVKNQEVNFIENNVFIISKEVADLENVDNLYYYNGTDGYYVKIVTTEDNYLFALDGCVY